MTKSVTGNREMMTARGGIWDSTENLPEAAKEGIADRIKMKRQRRRTKMSWTPGKAGLLLL
ncbi:MAG: hypothetical protein LLG37_04000 [Spirochaetia bacterium]|nr:hypothetical protein [Spirochaetia bacterium]